MGLACSVGRVTGLISGCAKLSVARGTWRLSCCAAGAACGAVLLSGLAFTAVLPPVGAGILAAGAGVLLMLGRFAGCSCTTVDGATSTAAAPGRLIGMDSCATGCPPDTTAFGRLTGCSPVAAAGRLNAAIVAECVWPPAGAAAAAGPAAAAAALRRAAVTRGRRVCLPFSGGDFGALAAGVCSSGGGGAVRPAGAASGVATGWTASGVDAGCAISPDPLPLRPPDGSTSAASGPMGTALGRAAAVSSAAISAGGVTGRLNDASAVTGRFGVAAGVSCVPFSLPSR